MIKPTKEFLTKLDTFIGTLTEDEKNQFAMFVRAFGDPAVWNIYESLNKEKEEGR